MSSFSLLRSFLFSSNKSHVCTSTQSAHPRAVLQLDPASYACYSREHCLLRSPTEVAAGLAPLVRLLLRMLSAEVNHAGHVARRLCSASLRFWPTSTHTWALNLARARAPARAPAPLLPIEDPSICRRRPCVTVLQPPLLPSIWIDPICPRKTYTNDSLLTMIRCRFL